jgi:hypothetical protein
LIRDKYLPTTKNQVRSGVFLWSLLAEWNFSVENLPGDTKYHTETISTNFNAPGKV